MEKKQHFLLKWSESLNCSHCTQPLSSYGTGAAAERQALWWEVDKATDLQLVGQGSRPSLHFTNGVPSLRPLNLSELWFPPPHPTSDSLTSNRHPLKITSSVTPPRHAAQSHPLSRPTASPTGAVPLFLSATPPSSARTDSRCLQVIAAVLQAGTFACGAHGCVPGNQGN